MTAVRVWAPYASQVDLYLRGAGRWSMEADDSGWWSCDVPELPAGIDYGFCLDGGEPLPDPRSAFQPYGIHGLSRTVDHAAFEWRDPGFRPGVLGAGLIYEMHVGTFTPQGTFAAAIEKLDYLKDLGVTHVELMPVAEFSGRRGWGYDGVHLYAPHHAYGTPEDLKRLVDEAHSRGLAVVLDVVYNHVGPAGNYLGRYGPYFTDRYRTPWGEAVNLDDAGSDEVRRFLIDNALMWLRDYRFDGLRLDAVHAMPDQAAWNFLEELQIEVEVLSAQMNRSLSLIAESNLNDPRFVQAREAGGYGLAALWCDDFHHAVHALLTGESAGYYADFGGAADLAKALRDGFVYDGRYSVYRKRRLGRPALDLSPHRLVVATQTHDQVGNRAQGERFVHIAGTDNAKIASALLFLAPQVPMLFQGEEWAASTPFLYFTDHEDPELGRAVSEGRRREFAGFGWSAQEVPDPQAVDTFTRSVLRWEELTTGEHAEMLQWYRDLIALRRSEPDLRDPRRERLRLDFDDQGRWLRLRRGAVLMLINLSEREEVYGLGGFSYRLVLASAPGVSLQVDAVYLPPDGVAILKDVT